jgi:hypothetical protein
MQYTRFTIYLNNNSKPKTVIQTLDLNTLSKRPYLYDYQQYLPYLNSDIVLKKSLDYYNFFTYFDYNLPFVKYFSQQKIIKIGLSEFFNITHYTNKKQKGYQGLDFKWDGKFDEFSR